MEKLVTILQVTIDDCNIRDTIIKFSVEFNDGQKKRDKKRVMLDDPEVLAEKIVFDIRNHVKDSGCESVTVKDEHEIVDLLSEFFTKVKTHIETMQNLKRADNYLSLLDELRTMKLNVEELAHMPEISLPSTQQEPLS